MTATLQLEPSTQPRGTSLMRFIRRVKGNTFSTESSSSFAPWICDSAECRRVYWRHTLTGCVSNRDMNLLYSTFRICTSETGSSRLHRRFSNTFGSIQTAAALFDRLTTGTLRNPLEVISHRTLRPRTDVVELQSLRQPTPGPMNG